MTKDEIVARIEDLQNDLCSIADDLAALPGPEDGEAFNSCVAPAEDTSVLKLADGGELRADFDSFILDQEPFLSEGMEGHEPVAHLEWYIGGRDIPRIMRFFSINFPDQYADGLAAAKEV